MMIDESTTREFILEFLLENGATPLCKFDFTKAGRKAVSNQLMRMYQEGILDRTKSDSKFAYSIRDREDFYLNNEPGYAYYLRNLPRSAVHDQLSEQAA
jgi:hypothetical protein